MKLIESKSRGGGGGDDDDDEGDEAPRGELICVERHLEEPAVVGANELIGTNFHQLIPSEQLAHRTCLGLQLKPARD